LRTGAGFGDPYIGTIDAAVGAAVQPDPGLGFLLQMAPVGTCAGTVVAYRRRRKDRDFDTFPIITRWTIAILLLGIPYVLIRAIL
jgi:hypothetical protein